MKKRRILDHIAFKKKQYDKVVAKRRTIPLIQSPSWLPSIEDIPVPKPIGKYT